MTTYIIDGEEVSWGPPDNPSTGPRSEAGKRRSAQNAVTHGLFAKVVLLPGESQEEFDAVLDGFIDEHKPQLATEEDLVRSLAENAWRRKRIINLEARAIEKATEAGETDCKFLNNFSLYDQRLNRTFQGTLKTLREHQGERWKQNGLLWRAAVIMLDYYQKQKIKWDPAEDGFVFSLADLEKQLAFNKRADVAMRNAYFYSTTKAMDERGAKEAA